MNAVLRRKKQQETKQIMRIDNTLLRQANAYSFKSEAKEIITNLSEDKERSASQKVQNTCAIGKRTSRS